jgi:hypothetical protein
LFYKQSFFSFLLPNPYFLLIFVAQLLPNLHFCCPKHKTTKQGEMLHHKAPIGTFKQLAALYE